MLSPPVREGTHGDMLEKRRRRMDAWAEFYAKRAPSAGRGGQRRNSALTQCDEAANCCGRRCLLDVGRAEHQQHGKSRQSERE